MEADEQEIDSLKVICSWYPLERHAVRNCEPLGHLHSPACSACGAVRGPDQIGGFPAMHLHPLPFGRPSRPGPPNPQIPPQSPALTVGLINTLNQPKEEHNSTHLFRTE